MFFNTKPEPILPSEKRFADVELSISKRYKSLDDKIDNRIDGLQDRFKHLDNQVSELLKRTYDAERKISGQLIDVENTAKQQFFQYDEKITKVVKNLDGKYSTLEDTRELISDIAELIKGIDTKLNTTNKEVKKVEAKIPQNTVQKKTVEDAIATINDSIIKVANAIPKETVAKSLLAKVERDLLKKFNSYATIDSVKTTKNEINNKINKVAKTSATTTNLNKKTQTQVDELTSLIKEIKQDYTPKSVLPTIDKKLQEQEIRLVKNDSRIKDSIPTEFTTPKELDIVKSSISHLNDNLIDTKTTLNTSINITQTKVSEVVEEASIRFNKKIKELEKAFSDKSGIDSNYMKTIIRDIADDEIKILRNQATLLQENTKQTISNLKTQNSDLIQRVTEVEKSFSKLVKLTRSK